MPTPLRRRWFATSLYVSTRSPSTSADGGDPDLGGRGKLFRTSEWLGTSGPVSKQSRFRAFSEDRNNEVFQHHFSAPGSQPSFSFPPRPPRLAQTAQTLNWAAGESSYGLPSGCVSVSWSVSSSFFRHLSRITTTKYSNTTSVHLFFP